MPPLLLTRARLDQLPVVITVWDRTRSLRYANRAAEAVLAKRGITRATGRRLEQIVSDDFLRAHEAYAADVLRGRTQSFHRGQISPDGQEHHFHGSRSSPVWRRYDAPALPGSADGATYAETVMHKWNLRHAAYLLRRV